MHKWGEWKKFLGGLGVIRGAHLVVTRVSAVEAPVIRPLALESHRRNSRRSRPTTIHRGRLGLRTINWVHRCVYLSLWLRGRVGWWDIDPLHLLGRWGIDLPDMPATVNGLLLASLMAATLGPLLAVRPSLAVRPLLAVPALVFLRPLAMLVPLRAVRRARR